MMTSSTYDKSSDSPSAPVGRTADTPVNRGLAARAERLWSDLLADAQTRAFHGTVAIEVAVQDGTIQHIRRRYERTEK